MCVVSMIGQHYMDKWPDPSKVEISKAEWYEYLELKRKALEYDLKTKQDHCQDNDKKEWEKLFEDYLKRKNILP